MISALLGANLFRLRRSRRRQQNLIRNSNSNSSNNNDNKSRRYYGSHKMLIIVGFIILFLIQRLSSIKDLHEAETTTELTTSTSTSTMLSTKVKGGGGGGGGSEKGLTSYDALLSNLKRKIKPICLIRGPLFFYQQKTTTSTTANIIISLSKAITIIQKEGIGRKLALDKYWSDFYASNFDNRHDILLNYDIGGRSDGEYCHQRIILNGEQQTFNYNNNNHDDDNDDDLIIMATIIPTLIPSKKIRSEAESILFRWQHGKRFISVHHNHYKSKEECEIMARRNQNVNTTTDWCPLDQMLEVCNIQYNNIPQPPEVNPLDYPDGYPVIFFPDEFELTTDQHQNQISTRSTTTISDQQKSTSTFPNILDNIQQTTSNNYMVNMWLMTRSQIHYGDPQSNVDAIIAYWRKNKRPMEPSKCWKSQLTYQKIVHNDLIKPLCLRTPFFERTNNRIISLMKLLQLNKNEKKGRKLGLDEDWSNWYIEHFDSYYDHNHHREVILYYYDPLFPNSETCEKTYDGYESFHINDWYYPILSKFVPRADYRYEAELIMSILWPSFAGQGQNKNNNGNWISVHRRNMEGLCLLFARCVDVDQNDWLTCHKERDTSNKKGKCSTKLRTQMCNMNYTMIEQQHHRYNNNHNTNTSLPQVILFTDNQVPKLDNTFPSKFDTLFKSTSHIFVEMWLQTKSKLHWGNPQSTFDLTIKYWRKRGTMEPKVCWSWGK